MRKTMRSLGSLESLLTSIISGPNSKPQCIWKLGSSTLRVQIEQPFYHKNPMACAAAHRATLRSLLGPDLHALGEEHLVNLPWWTHWDNVVQCLAATHPDAIPDRFSRTENGITNTPSGFCLKIGYGTISHHIPKFDGQSPLFCVLPIKIRSLRRGSINPAFLD